MDVILIKMEQNNTTTKHMENKSAVEWLEEKLKQNLKHIVQNADSVMMELLFLQAKQMEKVQRENDWVNGGKAGYNAATGKDFKTFQEYYKENYGTE